MFLLISRNVLNVLAMATFLHICQAKSSADESSRANVTDGSLWQPKEGTRSEWMACRGMPKDVCERIKIKKQELQRILAKQFGMGDIGNDSLPDSGVDQCIMFTEEQLDRMIAEAKNEEKATTTHRSKRTLIDFKKNPFLKWSMPIPYMFDGAHNDKQKSTIRGAFKHWTDNTCLRFRELRTNASFDSNHILITKNESDGCWSYVGKINQIIPQPMNLASGCVHFGIILHEIGHSLGLFHEQERSDRNDSIKILWSNIEMGAWSQYMEEMTDALGLPYNYGSVMHYSSKGGFSVNGSDTMIALQPLYQMNMGQTVDLSFRDVKIINLAYCNGTCSSPPSQPCQRGGYQNLNKCATCICPDGFSGQYCNEIAPPKNAKCGGILNVVPETQHVINSPGYNDTGYSQHQECTWWIKAPENYKLQLEFNGSFSIKCWGSGCDHWVEIKYKKDLGLEGARFCCDRRPNDTVVSETNEMMVIFRSNYSIGPEGTFGPRGFQAIVRPKSIPPDIRSSSATSTPRVLLQLIYLLLLQLPLALRRV